MIQIGWMTGMYCENKCPYCDPKGNRMNMIESTWTKKFNYEKWLESFNKIGDDFYLLVTGGEPFSNLNLGFIINDIAKMKNCLGIRVDSSLPLCGLNTCESGKILLNASYHVWRQDFNDFVINFNRFTKDFGYKVGMINIVLSKCNIHSMEKQKINFDYIKNVFKGICKVNPQIDFNEVLNGDINKKALMILDGRLDKKFEYFKLGGSPKGLKCKYGMYHYNLESNGDISVGCMYKNKRNFINDKKIPELMKEENICQNSRCLCLHAFQFTENFNFIGDTFKNYINEGIL